MEQPFPKPENLPRHPQRQYDISRSRAPWISVPHNVAGRLDASDYVFFNYDSSFPASKYRVVVESADNASPNPMDRYRDIGPLEKIVELPDVMFSQGFGSHAQIGVVPKDGKYPAYIGNLVRGNTYTIEPNSEVVSKDGHRALHRTGMK